MTHEIQVTGSGFSCESNSFVFPGGEVQLEFPKLPKQIQHDVLVTARVQSSDDLMRLGLATEVVRRLQTVGTRSLFIPYLPYARQDRVMDPRQAFSLKPFASLINSLGYAEVITCDLHSPVSAALIEGVVEIGQAQMIERFSTLRDWIIANKPVLVSPDAGASKKTLEIARRLAEKWDCPLTFLQATKVRNVATGEITETRVEGDMAPGEWTALIIDDICDGGRTFVELAKALRRKGASSVMLYVTHGIFSKGAEVFAGLIDGVFTTDSFRSPYLVEPHALPTVTLRINPQLGDLA
ncbi:MAG: ribose-phosphate diphosphokinase [Paludisphaera borealis]|uniref:ribose-phosphate diphosphokinase n=1 Tax=Paludisphaera borealis TaxID=1387353 RepID=UPI0028403291|nr:ribose-phosphate diphosphokinase [Paludisphaera borealis]MDR3620488.1 ribose-phosphate diphosphokinase [Paludisphaera borealis]